MIITSKINLFKYILTAPENKKFLPLDNPIYKKLIDSDEMQTAKLHFNNGQLIFISDYEYSLSDEGWNDVFIPALIDV